MASLQFDSFFKGTIVAVQNRDKGPRKMAVLVAGSVERGEARCVMVSLQMDDSGKELLEWAINRVTKRGDSIIAVNVCRDSGQFLASTYRSSSSLYIYTYDIVVSSDFFFLLFQTSSMSICFISFSHRLLYGLSILFLIQHSVLQ